MDLSSIPILDHHAHPLLRPLATADPLKFQRWFTESTHPQVHERDTPHTIFLRSGVRWLADFLHCEPTLEAVLTERAKQPYAAWVRALIEDANITQVLCDYGYLADEAYSAEEMDELLPCEVRPIMRIESVAEKFIEHYSSFSEMVDIFGEVVSHAREDGYVAFKSIAAYRSGLDVQRPSVSEAQKAFQKLHSDAQQTGTVRLNDKPLNDYLLWLVVEEATRQQLPIQFHTGFGDQDADLRTANPLHLRSLIEQSAVPLVLLHSGWPFYRETAHLAAIYPHVYLDLSLAIPFATTGIPGMLREILGMMPHNKILFATDAFTMPEIYWLAARWGRWGLSQVLDEFVADQFLTEQEAWSTAESILHNNSQQLYLLSNEL